MPIPNAISRPIRILVVDDTYDWRLTIADLLAQTNREIEQFATPIEALDAAAARGFDIAVLDMRLNGDEDDGAGIVLALAALYLIPKLHVIFVSLYSHESPALKKMTGLASVNFLDKGQPDLEERMLGAVENASEAVLLAGSDQPKEGLMQPLHSDKVVSTPFLSEEDQTDTILRLTLERGETSQLWCTGEFVGQIRSRKTFKCDPTDYHNWWRVTPLKRKQLRDLGKKAWCELICDYDEIKTDYGKAMQAANTRRTQLILRVAIQREMQPVPIELMWSDDSDEYLVLKHPLSRFISGVPPVRPALSPRNWGRIQPLRILLIASNTYTESGTLILQAIDGVDTEVADLETILKNSGMVQEVTKLKTEDASLQAVKDALRRPYDIIHFAGHATFDRDSPENSGLWFWRGPNREPPLDFITANELQSILEGHDIAARLVFLSCCHGTATGSALELLDDDCMGLADGVVRAGVPTVVGHRWTVTSNRAAALAKAFYKSLLEEKSPEIALWRARRDLAGKNRDELAWLSPILIHQE